ncbi:DUF3710 domain-containing protein [Pseudolysinimonas yzui]|uniref:DUF3710 domain-containing protein n=1 Tax=Pseudolysinimonas yzui TaxID=2708254 RepID=A0A8J3GNR3_9MICO|nr:DUF3710 domain-containing protein [Pseudolysinimonas yzui]GHF08405.1 hypothetical protein GCM10011600_06560 [Pseudolysinimonas yzui]
MSDTEHPKSAPADRATAGPFDDSEANPVRPYVDLGGIKLVPRADLAVRLEVEEGNKRVVAVALDYAGSTLQLQPFAAPRSSGLWHEIREQIVQQIEKQGGRTAASTGSLGPELRAEIPAPDAKGARIARFVGVDGPRWFLRGVISGEAAVNPEAAAKVEELFRSVVVVRGTTPMPPRDLIPLHVPASVAGATAPGATPTGPAAQV